MDTPIEKMGKIQKFSIHQKLFVQENQWKTCIKRVGEPTLNLRDKCTKRILTSGITKLLPRGKRISNFLHCLRKYLCYAQNVIFTKALLKLKFFYNLKGVFIGSHNWKSQRVSQLQGGWIQGHQADHQDSSLLFFGSAFLGSGSILLSTCCGTCWFRIFILQN